MYNERILCAGFGGQGVMSLGKLIAHAGLLDGRHVTWMPSYGPEMRGGTANVIVCLSSKPIGSPLIESPRGLLVMNLPSLEKFAPKVKPGGVIVVNSSLIDRAPDRDDCDVVQIAARDVAVESGAERSANFVMLGAYVGATAVLPEDALERAIESEFKGNKAKFVPGNVAAFRAGMAVGAKTKLARSS